MRSFIVMIDVIVLRNNRVIKHSTYNEKKQENAFEKAFVEIDIASWAFEDGDAIGLFQNKKLLRSFSNPKVGWVHANNNGIYEM